MKYHRILWVLAPVLFLTSCYYGPGRHPMGNGGFMGGGYGFGGYFMGLLLIIVVALIIFFVYQQSKKGGGSGLPWQETPLDILKKRYARGEITKEEFERLKRDLEN